MRLKILPTGITLGLLLFQTAHAQRAVIPESMYRKDMPATMTPAAPVVTAAPAHNRNAFSSVYAKAGRPAIVVLWNRDFTDMLQQDTASQVSVDMSSSGNSSRHTSSSRNSSSTEINSESRGNTTITAQTVKSQQALRDGPIERINLQMRSAFLQTLTSAGIRLVDRNLVMRNTAASKKGGNLDSQEIEMAAMSKHAKILMEVLNTQDPASPTGWATYISIKRLADGVLLTEGYMDGRIPEPAVQPAPQFEPDPNGGFRRVVKPAAAVNVGDTARLVAEQTLMRLGDALTR